MSAVAQRQNWNFEKDFKDNEDGQSSFRSLTYHWPSLTPIFLCDTELYLGLTICSHLSPSYDSFLLQNLWWIIKPYSVMEIECVMQQVGQGQQAIETGYIYAPSSHSMAVDQIYFMGC
jgi:hypothetical protein